MILFWYVLRQFFRYVWATVCLSLFLFILFDFIHKSTNYFAKYNPTPYAIIQFYIAQLPFQIVQAIPIASLLSSVIVMVMLSRGNEVTAMRAAGMSPWRVAAPLAAGGLILSVSGFLVSEFLVPRSAKHMHFVRKVLIEGNDNFNENEKMHWARNGNQILYFGEYDPSLQTLQRIKLIDISPSFLPIKAVHAKSARYMPEYDYWELQQIHEISFNNKGEVTATSDTSRLTMFLPIEPKKLTSELRLPDEMSIRDLGEMINRGKKYGADILSLRIAWHVKWAYALAAFVISLIGVQFGYRSERTTETVRSVILAFCFGISYWFILSACRALASAGSLHPFFAAWMANFILMIAVGAQLWRINAN